MENEKKRKEYKTKDCKKYLKVLTKRCGTGMATSLIRKPQAVQNGEAINTLTWHMMTEMKIYYVPFFFKLLHFSDF